MIFPTIILGCVVGLIVVIFWSIKKKRFPTFFTGVKIIVSTLGICGGLAYFGAGLFNYLNSLWNVIPIIEISDEEFLGVIMLAGVILILLGIDAFLKAWRLKK